MLLLPFRGGECTESFVRVSVSLCTEGQCRLRTDRLCVAVITRNVIFNGPGSNTDHDTAHHDGLSLLFFSFLSCNTGILGILDSSVGIVTRLRVGRPRKCSSIHAAAGYLFYLQNIQTGSGTHPSASLVGTGGFFAGNKTVET